jgi:TonB family protein
MKQVLSIFILLIPCCLFAQQNPSNDSIHLYAEQMPQFPGGETELMKFLSKNIHYPVEAREKGIQGKVLTQFVVDENGAITDVQILKGIGGGCDEEVIRVLKIMPPWKPGMTKGSPVKVYFNMPVTFGLGGDEDKNHGVQFVGYEIAYQKFIKKNLKYPTDAKKNKIGGVVYLTFHVDKNGKASEVKVLKSLSLSCDQEALRLFNLIPEWLPAVKNGEAIDANGNMIVEFKR